MPITWIINPFTGALDAIGTPGSGAPFVTSVAGGVGITNSPEPIVGAGTVNLDIDSLTTESTLAAGDLFAFVDVSAGGTAIDNQRKVAFSDIAAAVDALIGPYQPLDAGLTALSSLGAGIAVSDGADGWTPRSIAVTDTATVDLTITNANGVAGNPTVQADVIVAGLNPLLDHGLLLGLTDDDHAQYTLRAGRTGTTNDTTLTTSVGGTGTLAGGTDVGAILKLVASTSGSAHTGFVRIDDAQDWWPSVPDTTGTSGFTVAKFDSTFLDDGASTIKTLIHFNPTVTAASAVQIDGEWNIFHVAGTIDNPGNPNLDEFYALRLTTEFTSGSPAVPGPWIRRLFADQSVTRVTAGTISVTDAIQSHHTLFIRPGFSADGATAFLGIAGINGTRFEPVFSGLNGGQVWGNSDADQPFDTIAHNVLNANVTTSGGGSVNYGTQVALNVADLTAATTNLSVRSLGALVQMRHAGPGVFGANAAPTNASVALEVQSTTRAFLASRMTTAQKTTLTGVAVADGMLLYDTTTTKFNFRENGAWVEFGTGTINGTGSTDAVAFWTDADTLSNDSVFLYKAAGDQLSVGASSASGIIGGENTSSANVITLAGSGVAGRLSGHALNTTAAVGLMTTGHNASGTNRGGTLYCVRSRGTAAGSNVVVAADDELMRIDAIGFDGLDFEVGTRVAAFVDGTPGSGDMPGRLVFYTTPDASATPAERFRIASAGQLGIGGANFGTAGQFLASGGAAAPPVWTSFSSVDHGSLGGLTDDDHTQYALLAGRSGGQVLIGGTASGNDLTLQSTSNATRGQIFFGSAATTLFDETNNNWTFEGQLIEYLNITLAGKGIPHIVSSIDSTGNSANITLTTLYAVPTDGFYRISAYVIITTVGTVSSTLPQVNITWQDGDNGVNQSIILTGGIGVTPTPPPGYASAATQSALANTTSTIRAGDCVVYANASSNISYSTSGYAANAANSMIYSVHIRVEAL